MQQNCCLFGLDDSVSPEYVLLLLNFLYVARCSWRFYIDKITNKKFGSKYLNIKFRIRLFCVSDVSLFLTLSWQKGINTRDFQG